MSRLIIKRVDVEQYCPVCGLDVENVMHALVECQFSRECWLLTSVGFMRGNSPSFMDWFNLIFDKCSVEDCQKALMLCWGLWKNRNDVVWQGKRNTPYAVVSFVYSFFEQWQQAQVQKVRGDDSDAQTGACNVKWKAPNPGWVKVNTDAAIFENSQKTGIGFVLRDHEGHFLAAVCKSLDGLFEPHIAEGLSVREALSWIKGLNIPKVEVESDAQMVVHACNSRAYDGSTLGLIIEDCQFFKNNFEQLRFSFVKRSANQVAHLIARAAGSLSGLSV